MRKFCPKGHEKRVLVKMNERQEPVFCARAALLRGVGTDRLDIFEPDRLASDCRQGGKEKGRRERSPH